MDVTFSISLACFCLALNLLEDFDLSTQGDIITVGGSLIGRDTWVQNAGSFLFG